MKNIIITAVNDNPEYIKMAGALEQSVIENGCAEFKCHVINDTALRASHSRARLIKETLLNGYDIVAWFDADTLVVRNLKPFWKDITPDSIKAFYRPHQVKKRRFNSGVVAFGANTIKFVREWENRLVGSTDIYADQLTLYKTYRTQKINLIKMSEKYNDHYFEDNSYIWHNKLKNKSAGKKFLKRQKEYETKKSAQEI